MSKRGADEKPTKESGYSVIGTAYDPTEEPQKFVPVWKQDVRDEEGRRRFHGAFTGGFSAGYFNTVGSKEGFTPTAFVSSRKQRAESRQQNVQDLMDAEDYHEQVSGGKTLVAKSEYEGLFGTAAEKAAKGPETSMTGALANLIAPAKDPIGRRLLRAMGWREGTGLGPRITRATPASSSSVTSSSAAQKPKYGVNLNELRSTSPPTLSTSGDAPHIDEEDDEKFNAEYARSQGFTFAPKNTEVITYRQKTDTYGIGFDPHSADPRSRAMALEAQQARKSIMGTAAGHHNPTEESAEEARNILPMSNVLGGNHRVSKRFGLGAFEEGADEDADVYTYDDRSAYDSSITKENEKVTSTSSKFQKPSSTLLLPTLMTSSPVTATSSRSCSDGRPPLRGFVLAEKPPPTPKWFAPPVVPATFVPMHKFEKARETKAPTLAPAERGEALGEVQLATSAADSLSFLAPADRQRLLAQKAETDRKLEEEKAKAAAKQREEAARKSSGMMSNRFVSSGIEFSSIKNEMKVEIKEEKPKDLQTQQRTFGGKLTRTSEEWIPENLLCKRFNIKNPHQGKKAGMGETAATMAAKEEKPSILNMTFNLAPAGNPPITKLDRSDNPYVLEPLGTPPSPAKPAKLKFSRDASEPYLLLPPEHDEAQFLEKFGTFTTPPDLDKFLRKVYAYFEGKGFWPIILSRVTNLIIYAFVLLFSTFLIVFIDYHVLFHLKPDYDITRAIRWERAKNFYIFWAISAFFYGFFFYLVVLLVGTIWDNLEMRRFYQRQLDIPEAEIPTIDWADVVKKIVKVPRLCVTKESLTQLDIALILMSRENYIIALFNKELLDIHIPGTKIKMYTKVLEWSLQFSLFTWMFEALQSKERMTESHRLTNTLRTRFVIFGLFFLLISPFVSVYLLLYYFFQYGESLRNRPGSVLGMRGWSRYAQWKFREFNELSHDFRHRLNKSIEPANFYVGQFQSVMVSILAKLVMFTAGGVLAVLLIWGVISEDLLVHGELGNRTLLFYVGVLSVVVGIARGLVPDENFVFQPQLYLDQVALHTHFHPRVWKNARSTNAQKLFDELYEYNIVAFLKELLGVLVAPFVLIFVLPGNADRVIQFFQEFTVYVAGIGPCCSFAYFPEMHAFGNAKHGAPRDAPKHKRTLHGKLEKSLVTFQSHYPDWQPTGDAERFFHNLSSAHVDRDDPLLSSMHVMRTPLTESAQSPLSASVQLCGSKDEEVLHRMQQSYTEQYGSRKTPRGTSGPTDSTMMTSSGVTASVSGSADRSLDPPISMQFVNSDA